MLPAWGVGRAGGGAGVLVQGPAHHHHMATPVVARRPRELSPPHPRSSLPPLPQPWPHGRCPLPAERTPSPQRQSARLTSPGGRAQRPVVPPRREAVTNATQTRSSRETGDAEPGRKLNLEQGSALTRRPAFTFFGFDDRATGGRLGCFGGHVTEPQSALCTNHPTKRPLHANADRIFS